MELSGRGGWEKHACSVDVKCRFSSWLDVPRLSGTFVCGCGRFAAFLVSAWVLDSVYFEAETIVLCGSFRHPVGLLLFGGMGVVLRDGTNRKACWNG